MPWRRKAMPEDYEGDDEDVRVRYQADVSEHDVWVRSQADVSAQADESAQVDESAQSDLSSNEEASGELAMCENILTLSQFYSAHSVVQDVSPKRKANFALNLKIAFFVGDLID